MEDRQHQVAILFSLAMKRNVTEEKTEECHRVGMAIS